MIPDGEKGFDTIVAIRHPYSDEEERELKIVSPCGMCRELISDYAPDCFIILHVVCKSVRILISDLITLEYSREN